VILNAINKKVANVIFRKNL